MTYLNSKRGRDSKDRGAKFEQEIAKSWSEVPNSWRLRLRDGGGGDRPADELVLLNKFRLLCELKCTSKKTFSVSTMLRPTQINGLMQFSKCNVNNLGLVLVKFEKFFVCHMLHIFDIVKWVSKNETFSFSIEDLQENYIKNIELSRTEIGWNLKNINERLNEYYCK